MDDLTTKIGIGSGAGVLGIVLSWFGLKSRVKDLKDSVRYADTCIAMHTALDKRLKNIETMQTEMRNDIKELIKRG